MSSTNELSTGSSEKELQRIDLFAMLRWFRHGFRRLWWLILVLAVAGGAYNYFNTSTVHTSRYTANAVVSVRSVSNSGTWDNSASTAQQLGKVFPYILTSGALSDIVAEDLGTGSVPGSITVSNIEGTNLLNITVTGSDGEMAYKVLQSVIENYPAVAQLVVGRTELTIIEDSGIPENTGVTVTNRGSVRRGAMMGFVIGLAIVALYSLSFRTIGSSEELKTLVNAHYLGTLPIYHKKRFGKDRSGEINILENNPQEDYVSSLNMVRRRLEKQMKEQNIKTFMVTSSVPGEGKSTVSANLAVSFAKKGKRVVLVDCDIRKPSAGYIFHPDKEYPGLAAVLNREATLKDALLPVTDDGIFLHVLVGAPQPHSNTDILGSKAMGDLIRMLEGTFDVVILDTPPSALLVDAQTLSRHVKNAVYVILNDYVRRQYIYRGVDELHEMGVHLLGCVLNGSKESSAEHQKEMQG